MSYVMTMISEGEHQRQDFKMRIDDARKIARTLSAFANTDGGRLLIGVKDNGIPCGIDPEQEMHMVEAAAKLFCRPAMNLEYTVWTAQNRQILEARVAPAADRPVWASSEPDVWDAFRRDKDTNIKANHIQVMVWQKKAEPMGEHFTYSEAEQQIFDLLKTAPSAGFKKISRVARLSGRRTEQVLAKLILWDLIEMHNESSGLRFALKKTPRQI